MLYGNDSELCIVDTVLNKPDNNNNKWSNARLSISVWTENRRKKRQRGGGTLAVRLVNSGKHCVF